MTSALSKENIIQQLEESANSFAGNCSAIKDEIFFYQPESKWSIAQNVVHLTTSLRNTALVYALPKFIIRLYVGKPNRPSRSYDELVSKYLLKLEKGGRASGRYIPAKVLPAKGKDKIINNFISAATRLNTSINNKWNDAQLDRYIAPHPLLGKITLRELCYFTIYHTLHHQNIIRERLKS